LEGLPIECSQKKTVRLPQKPDGEISLAISLGRFHSGLK